MATYRVCAPYVTLKVKDDAGSDVIKGFYEGALVSGSVDEDNLKHHLDGGMVEKVKASDVPAEKPADEPPSEALKSEAPAEYASKGDWVDYAVSKGAAIQDAEASTKADLIAAYGA